MQSEMNFYKFDRAEWSQFHSQNFTSVTDAELAQLRSLNDEISSMMSKPSIHHYAT
ncbi:hypothetical protein N577_000995 [Lacticaseibacillus rhamnosus 2166]|nr:hypothetical protein N577_000995 [Lacticaseibacillus rhamnosus 2166]